MNYVETLSVNPVSKTLGSLHPEALTDISNTKKKDSVISHIKAEDSSLSRFFFASSSPTAKRFGAQMLLFRVLFSALLIVSGCFILSGNLTMPTGVINPFYFGLGEIIAGSMLALGLLSRVAMTLATIAFGYVATLAAISGSFDASAILSLIGSMAFLTMGSGKYSSDFLIRKAIVMRAIRKEKRLREERLSYRAFRIQNMQ